MAKHAFHLPPIIPDDDEDEIELNSTNNTTISTDVVDQEQHISSQKDEQMVVAQTIDESTSLSTKSLTDSHPKQVIIPPPLELLSVAEAAAKESNDSKDSKSTNSMVHKVDGIVSSIPMDTEQEEEEEEGEEEEVESGQILDNIMVPPNPQSDIASPINSNSFMSGLMADSPKCILAPPLSTKSINSTNSSEDTINCGTNNTTKMRTGYDPTSYTLAANGRLMEEKDEWERRPKLTFDKNGEMVFRPLRMQCTHCDESYTKTSDLYQHIRTHQRHTECPHCGKILTCMATFVYHVRTHTMEKPYYCPCDGCDFKNAVKYNLKVHLACIRHGGKSNLAKYAKVLDLDVCDKSLRKRKDNSVHELGSRRSKKRRKLNHSSRRSNSRGDSLSHHSKYGMSDLGSPYMNGMNMNGHHDPHGIGMNAMNPLMAMQGINALNGLNPYGAMGGMMNAGYYGQSQEEYDQFAAQLLFQLSAYQNGNGQMYDQNAIPNGLQMDWTQNVNGGNGQPVVDQNGNIIVGNNQQIQNQQQQQVVDSNGNAVNAVNALKGELNNGTNGDDGNAVNAQNAQNVLTQQLQQQQQLMQMMGMNPQMQMQQMQMMELKPEQVYDPNYGYFGVQGVQMQPAYSTMNNQGANPLEVNTLNVDSNHPTTNSNAINSKDSINSKVSNTLSTATPREMVPEHNGDNQPNNGTESGSDEKQKENDNQTESNLSTHDDSDNGKQQSSTSNGQNQNENENENECNSMQQDSNEMNELPHDQLIPKQEPQQQQHQQVVQQENGQNVMNQYMNYDQQAMNQMMMAQQNQMNPNHPMMVQVMTGNGQHDPNAVLMMQQQQQQYEQAMPMTAQYMMAPTYYQPVATTQDAFYGQLQQLQMYGDPSMTSPTNMQQLQMMQMQGLLPAVPGQHEVESEKKADPPLPSNLQFLDQPDPNQNQIHQDQPAQILHQNASQ